MKSEKGVLFPDNKFREANLMGRVNFKNSIIDSNEKITDIMKQIHDDTNGQFSKNVCAYYAAIIVKCTNQSFFEHIPLKHFVSSDINLLNTDCMPDIGHYIRNIIIGSEQGDSLCRLIQYSMPYIKHNRLHFCKFSQTTHEHLYFKCKMILATCLGTYPGSNKAPLWIHQFNIIDSIYHILTRGNAADLYTFCKCHPSLLRVAVIEYFVHFVTTNMPMELSVLGYVLKLENKISQIMRQLYVIVDSFRASCFQGDHFTWEEVENKAHFVSEKCNRVCKGKTRLDRITPKKSKHANARQLSSFSVDNFKFVMLLPKFIHCQYTRCIDHSITCEQVKLCRTIHSLIQTYPLPANFRRRQFDAIENVLHTSGHILMRSMNISICVKCALTRKDVFNTKGRITHTGNMECIHCNTDQYVVNVNTLGRIVRVYDISFYFCTTCLKVHQWQSSGQDLIECHKQEVKPTKRQTQCVFCEKTHGLDQIHLLNSDIGVSNSVLLCSKHMPCKFQLPYLTDFSSYWRAMNHKKQLFKK